MEIRKFLNKWTIGMNVIGLSYVGWLYMSGILEALWGALFVAFLVCSLYLLSLTHSFFVKGLKDKFAMSCSDIFPILAFLLYGGLLYSEIENMIIGILSIYILPTLAITILSYGLTYLWRRYKK